MAEDGEETPPYSLTLEDGTVVHASRDYNGRGRAVYANGEVYDGVFDEGVRHGEGTYWYINGDVYTGQFQENEKHGVGRLVYTGKKVVVHPSVGARIMEQFKEGQKHGQGTYKFDNGDVYSGDWCKGQKHGSGTYVYKDGGLRYTGDFKENKPYGEGYWKMPCRQGHMVSGKYVHEDIPTEDGEESMKGGISLRFVADSM
ncbi:hypothetical protein FOZ60_014432 [Perkinsus olseni]|uniref:Phosphatidylinositol-4-phosphate 5-kinase-like protein 1 n=1 Tax=Perkinsus olseni TaxID=32597 RepID=A0A7J6P768_PEROL|nr:hypothetical protein FOZ60_014432 [Perkinsus olseni]